RPARGGGGAGFRAGRPEGAGGRLPTPAAGDALAERVKAVPEATWIGDLPTAWIWIAGPDLDELGRLATRLTAKLEVVERAGTQVVPSLAVAPDGPRLLALHIPAS